MLKQFTAHPAAVGETYGQHLVFAWSFGARMVAGGAACVVHGLLPFLFTTRGSRTVRALHHQLEKGRSTPAGAHRAMLDAEYTI